MKRHKKHSSLENEVIIAVTLLYLLIMGAVLAIHFIQRVPAEVRAQSIASPPPEAAPALPAGREK
jgi:hypothetical protein